MLYTNERNCLRFLNITQEVYAYMEPAEVTAALEAFAFLMEAIKNEVAELNQLASKVDSAETAKVRTATSPRLLLRAVSEYFTT